MADMQNVLIAGGSGYIGSALRQLLTENGYLVSILSRDASRGSVWDPAAGAIDMEVLQKADHIINLAGTNVGDKRWSKRRKELILSSRVLSNQLLFKSLQVSGHTPGSYVSASAIGIYGHSDAESFVESDPPATDYLGQVGKAWEESSMLIEKLGIRTVILRTGIVFSEKSLAIKQMKLPLSFGLSPLPGNGQQVLPWIHLQDLCQIYLKAIQDEQMKGVYNAVAPIKSTNQQVMAALGAALGKRGISLPTPKILINFALGELADFIFYSVPVSAEKIQGAGFQFKYPNLKSAFDQIFVS